MSDKPIFIFNETVIRFIYCSKEQYQGCDKARKTHYATSVKTYGINKIWPIFVALNNDLHADVRTVLLKEFAKHLTLKMCIRL